MQRLFATGHSQSAGRLATYVNSVHPLAPIFDAVVVHGGGGRIRPDLGTLKVWKLSSETDVLGSQAAVRQPDYARISARGKSPAIRTSISSSSPVRGS